MEKADRKKLIEILRKTCVFRKNEIAVAIELIDIYIKNPKQKDYIFFVAESNGVVAGYICYGQDNCTQGAYNIYWIAVSPDFQGMGIGGKLLEFAERKIMSRKGEIIVVETSSTKKYEPTRKFYLAKKYRAEAILKDFYKNGDDKVIFIKRLSKNNKKFMENSNGKMEKNVA
jgi:ribosomal protein S18 acetylase RimI-like enzyme